MTTLVPPAPQARLWPRAAGRGSTNRGAFTSFRSRGTIIGDLSGAPETGVSWPLIGGTGLPRRRVVAERGWAGGEGDSWAGPMKPPGTPSLPASAAASASPAQPARRRGGGRWAARAERCSRTGSGATSRGQIRPPCDRFCHTRHLSRGCGRRPRSRPLPPGARPARAAGGRGAGAGAAGRQRARPGAPGGARLRRRLPNAKRRPSRAWRIPAIQACVRPLRRAASPTSSPMAVSESVDGSGTTRKFPRSWVRSAPPMEALLSVVSFLCTTWEACASTVG